MNSSVTKVTQLQSIENADRIEIARLGNYQTVVQKGKYKVGDEVVFVQADSVLPDADWAEPYREYAKKRVKIVKLKGVYSEGIVVPMSTYLEEMDKFTGEEEPTPDLVLGITHYERPMPQDMTQGQIKSGLPAFLPKTDAERWENVLKHNDFLRGVLTQKIDGTSATYVFRLEDGNTRVFSRGIEYDPDADNIYTRVMDMYNINDTLQELCEDLGVNLAVRGEIYGNNIQKNNANPHSGLPLDFAMFSVLDLNERRYDNLKNGRYFKNIVNMGVPSVPIIDEYAQLSIRIAQDLSEVESIGEGYVFWTTEPFPRAIKILSKSYDASK